MDSDQNSKLLDLSNMGIPKAYCAYHPSHTVLNFCRNPSCLMPLCQDCIKLHQQEHYQNNTLAQFDTVEDVYREVKEGLETLKLKYMKHKGKQNEYSAKLQSHDVVLYEQLKIARQKVNEVVDKFFSALHQDILSKQFQCKERQEVKLNEHYKIINERAFDYESILKKLQGEHFLKYIIEFLNSSCFLDEKNFEKDADAILSIFNMQLMDVMIDSAKLQDIKGNLNAFVTVSNESLYEGPQQPLQSQIVQIQSAIPQVSQLPQIQQTRSVQSFSQLPQPNIQSSNNQANLSQSINYTNAAMRTSNASPGKIMSTQPTITSFLKPAYYQVVSSRAPIVSYQNFIPYTQQKIYYPNTSMHQSIKFQR